MATSLVLRISLLLVLVICSPGLSDRALAAETVALPITIDYSLMKALIARQAFPENGSSTTLINEGDGCIYLALSDLHVEEQNKLLRLETAITVRAGTPLAGNCFAQVEWSGYLVSYQQLALSADSWQLSFISKGFELLDGNRRPVKIISLLWSMVESHVLSYLSAITIDLAPPVEDLKNFLLPLFPSEVKQQTEKMLASLRPGPIRIEPEYVYLEILADVESVYRADEALSARVLEGEALTEMISLWEQWDALLSYMVITISEELLSETEQLMLIDVLLETRHRFVNALDENSLTKDFVREQFIIAWKELAPLFKNRLYHDAPQSRALGYLAFISSADALLVFDRLGPTVGIEISRTGLLRLVQMLKADPTLLEYSQEPDSSLQKLFQIKPDTTDPQPSLPAQPPLQPDTESRLNSQQTIFLRLSSLLSVPKAVAAQPTMQEILRWKVPKKDVAAYLSRVEKVLKAAVQNLLKNGKVPNEKHKMFTRMIPAMAWQESCLRQFVVKKSQLTYLLSYNQTSVGVMQVNERVWRGLYNREKLRWDIHYNARAGSEIAALYLRKYALRDTKVASTLDDTTLARLVYAMYNGGPGQYKKFLARLRAKDFYKSDKLFFEKYSMVKEGWLNEASKCLIGG